jgi:lysophospholipase L1-like esterase
MRATFNAAIAALILFAGCSSSDSSTANTQTSVNAVLPAVNIIGDSITAKSKDKITLDDFDLFIYAVFGISIEEQLPAIEAAIARSPNVLVIQLGGNDMGHWGPSIVAEVNQILDDAADLDCVRWVNLGGAIPNLAEMNNLLADQAASRDNFAVIDWAQAAADHPEWLELDGVHPSDPDGEVGFAALVAESVRACPL